MMHRKPLIGIISIILLLTMIILLWRYVSLSIVTDLWNKPENRQNIYLNLVSSLLWAILGVIVLIFRRTIFRTAKILLFRERTEAERERLIQEQLYLDNLIERFRREYPWEVEKYSALEVLQEARQLKVHFWSIGNEGEKQVEGNIGAHIDMLSFLSREKGPIMLKGDPGTGKTLTVRRFAYEEALEQKKHPGKGKIPLYIFLGFYTGKTPEGEPEPVFDFLQRYLQSFPSAAYLREHLTEYLLQGRFLLLFDGLNELPVDEYLPRYDKLEEFALLNYPKNKVIFTCRTLRFTAPSKFNTVAISNLDNTQIKRFITAYMGASNAEGLYRELTSGDGFMLRVCRNPFMLRMLVSHDVSQNFPQTPAQLFEQYVHYRLAALCKNVDQTITVLREIAFSMQLAGKFTGVISISDLQQQLPHLALEEHLQIAARAELIDYTADRKIRFYHQILQEYFAATSIQQEWESGKNLDLYFHDHRWEETILVCAGIAKDPEAFIRTIWTPTVSSSEAFWLAIKAVGSSGNRVSNSYLESILQQAEQYLALEVETGNGYSKIVRIIDTVKSLSYIDNDETAQLLSATLFDYPGWVREVCIQTLGNSRNPQARTELRNAVVQLRSLPILLLVVPYFTRYAWLTLVASSVASFPLLTNAFWFLSRLVFFIVPGIYLGVLMVGSQLFNTDPLVLLGRTVAISVLTLVIAENARPVFAILGSPVHGRAKLKALSDIVLSESIALVLIASLWVFSDETEMLLAIGLRATNYLLILSLFITILLNILHPQRVVCLLYSWMARLNIWICTIVAAGLLTTLLLPSTGQIPLNFHASLSTSLVETILLFIDNLLWYPLLVYIVACVIYITAAASVLVHLVVYFNYWRIRADRIAFTRKGNRRALEHILWIATRPATWQPVRKQAFRTLRLMNVPAQYISDLNNLIESNTLDDITNYGFLMRLFANYQDLRSELERTVYELLSRVREEIREMPDEQYLVALVNRGYSRAQIGYYQEALTLLNRAITLKPDHIPALLKRGETYTWAHRDAEALSDFDRALALGEQTSWLYAHRGNAYWALNQLSAALADFDQAISLDQLNGWAYGSRGGLHCQLDHLDEALADLNRAIDLGEQDSWSFSERGYIHFLLQNYPVAIADYHKAIDLDATDSKSLSLLGETYLKMGQINDALTTFRRAIEIAPADPAIISSRGEIYLLKQEYIQALKDFQYASSLDKKNDRIWFDLAVAHKLLQNPAAFQESVAKAVELAQQALQIEPQNYLVAFNLALYLLLDEHIAEAQDRYHTLMVSCPSLLRLQVAADDLAFLLHCLPQLSHVQVLHAELVETITTKQQSTV